jgi:aspartyl-tRNA(Asn)/glutamyl-tRNA(Gln) amidotransferase subunit A
MIFTDTEIVDNRTEAFGDEVKRRILVGTFVLQDKERESYYDYATKVKEKIKDDFKQVFQEG